MGKEAMKRRTILRARRCRAAAVVEMAIVTPVLLTMLFGIIEYGWVFTIKQSLTNAAREGCRVASMQGSTDAQVTGAVRAYLNSSGLQPDEYDLTMQRATTADPTEQVSIRVPYSKVSLLGGFFSGGSDWTIGSTCTMRKEGAD